MLFRSVSRPSASDEPFVMALLFRAPFKENPLHGPGGNLELHFPHLGGEAEQGHAAVAIQQLKIAVWVPKEFTLVGQPPQFHSEYDTHLDVSAGASVPTFTVLPGGPDRVGASSHEAT